MWSVPPYVDLVEGTFPQPSAVNVAAKLFSKERKWVYESVSLKYLILSEFPRTDAFLPQIQHLIDTPIVHFEKVCVKVPSLYLVLEEERVSLNFVGSSLI